MQMDVIKPSFSIEPIDGKQMLQNIEKHGRICYKSESNITINSAKIFVANLIKNGHESVLEHEKVTVVITCDRGVSHEIVRHRIGSYSQESTRYVNLLKKGITFIDPLFFKETTIYYRIWKETMEVCERAYNILIDKGATPQEARSVLPNSLKTEIAVTYNLREWRHFFKLRTSKKAHPQMREIAVPLLKQFKTLIPVVFDDINSSK
jgi:thymidylate synthase (FAD)